MRQNERFGPLNARSPWPQVVYQPLSGGVAFTYWRFELRVLSTSGWVANPQKESKGAVDFKRQGDHPEVGS